MIFGITKIWQIHHSKIPIFIWKKTCFPRSKNGGKTCEMLPGFAPSFHQETLGGKFPPRHPRYPRPPEVDFPRLGRFISLKIPRQNLGPLVKLLVGPTFVKSHDQLKGAVQGIRRSPDRCAKTKDPKSWFPLWRSSQVSGVFCFLYHPTLNEKIFRHAGSRQIELDQKRTKFGRNLGSYH